jgi:hypothetical protein
LSHLRFICMSNSGYIKSIRYLLEVCNTQKLKECKIEGTMLLFITNFTKDKSFWARVGYTFSRKMNIKNGIVHGAVIVWHFSLSQYLQRNGETKKNDRICRWLDNIHKPQTTKNGRNQTDKIPRTKALNELMKMDWGYQPRRQNRCSSTEKTES